MGYIFDALTRAGSAARTPGQTPASVQRPAPAPEHEQPATTFKFPGAAEAAAARSAETVNEAPAYEPRSAEEAPAPAVARKTKRPGSKSSSGSGNSSGGGSGGGRHGSTRTHGVDERLVAITDPSSQIAEEYRAIRTSLLAKWEHRRHLVHTVTSATPQEGKTLTSLNLGFSFAELRNRRTLVIEADLRLPQFRKLISLPQTPGLVGVLEEGVPVERAVVRMSGYDLDILPAGGRLDNDAVQVLSSPALTNLIKQLRHQYDHVVIDTPPVVELADAGIIGAQSDDVLLIARMNRTPKALIQQAIRTLASYKAPVAGLIATDQSRHRRRYYYYRYGYKYQYHSARRRAA